MTDLATGEETMLTAFEHPQPQLKGVKPSLITYTRKDGIDLNAMLYTPAGYNPATDGPRPCLMWAYPVHTVGFGLLCLL